MIKADLNETTGYLKMNTDKRSVDWLLNYEMIFMYVKGVTTRRKSDTTKGHLTKETLKQCSNVHACYVKEMEFHLKQAADLGHVKTMHNLATILKDENGVDKDIHDAAQYFKMAAEKKKKKTSRSWWIITRFWCVKWTTRKRELSNSKWQLIWIAMKRSSTTNKFWERKMAWSRKRRKQHATEWLLSTEIWRQWTTTAAWCLVQTKTARPLHQSCCCLSFSVWNSKDENGKKFK